jgi:hypothetical protein
LVVYRFLPVLVLFPETLHTLGPSAIGPYVVQRLIIVETVQGLIDLFGFSNFFLLLQ